MRRVESLTIYRRPAPQVVPGFTMRRGRWDFLVFGRWKKENHLESFA
jgi:hypothetical protein